MLDAFWFNWFGREMFIVIPDNPYNPKWSDDAQILLDKLENNDAA